MMNTYVCLNHSNFASIIDIGKIVAFHPINGSQGLMVHYSHASSNISTFIEITCAPNIELGSPTLNSPFNFNNLSQNINNSINFLWNTKYGCPFCTSNDYKFRDSSCVNGKITRTYYWFNQYCFGGVSLPNPVSQDCQCLVNNGGCDPLTTCTDIFGGRICSQCPIGYSGNGDTKCIPVCEPSCQNNGICSSPNVCNCSSNYTGNLCQTPICEPTCQNYGVCSDVNICDCSKTGYNGTYCEIPICDPPCINNGTCISPQKCNCSKEFFGARCQLIVGVDDVTNNGGLSKGAIATIAIGGLILVSALAGLFILWRKNRKLYESYTRLKESNIPMENNIEEVYIYLFIFFNYYFS
jgi:hypothetical protein